MGILPTVFTHARRISLDVTRIMRCTREGRREQPDNAGLLIDQMLHDGIHGLPRPTLFAFAGENAPALAKGIDPALLAFGGTERRAVIEITAPVIAAIPTRCFQRVAQPFPMRCPFADAVGIATLLRNRDEIAQRPGKEPAEPDAGALAADTDAVHAIVPVAA
ncbi:hypothetical protein D3C86_1319530 [compost metagenome]